MIDPPKNRVREIYSFEENRFRARRRENVYDRHEFAHQRLVPRPML